MEYESNILRYVNIYKKHRYAVLAVICIAIFLAIAVGYILPTTYTSTVVILSSKESSQISSLGKYLGFSDMSATSTSDEIIFSMLKSRRMHDDIDRQFKLKGKPNFWWRLSYYLVTGGFAIEVKGSDPDLTERIANFAVEDLDKINSELQITPNKPMAKVLDPAVRGVPQKRDIFKNVLIAVIFSFSLFSFYIFFSDYIKKQKLV